MTIAPPLIDRRSAQAHARKDTVARFDYALSSESGHLLFPDDVSSAIERHRKTLAI